MQCQTEVSCLGEGGCTESLSPVGGEEVEWVAAGAGLSSAPTGGAVARSGRTVRAAPLSGRGGASTEGPVSARFGRSAGLVSLGISRSAQPSTMGKRDNRVVSIWREEQWGDVGPAAEERDPSALPAGPEGRLWRWDLEPGDQPPPPAAPTLVRDARAPSSRLAPSGAPPHSSLPLPSRPPLCSTTLSHAAAFPVLPGSPSAALGPAVPLPPLFLELQELRETGSLR